MNIEALLVAILFTSPLAFMMYCLYRTIFDPLVESDKALE